MKKTKLRVFLALALFLALPVLGALAQDLSEYTVKAAYLLNFVKFVDWPDKVYADDDGAVVIGILGDDPFGDALDEMVSGKVIEKHPVVIRRFDSFNGAQSAQLRRCHVLFISYSEKDRLSGILQAVRGAPVLTVSEIERFTAKGGMILFDQEGDRITLAINKRAAEKSGLILSSQLLQVARIYKGE